MCSKDKIQDKFWPKVDKNNQNSYKKGDYKLLSLVNQVKKFKDKITKYQSIQC